MNIQTTKVKKKEAKSNLDLQIELFDNSPTRMADVLNQGQKLSQEEKKALKSYISDNVKTLPQTLITAIFNSKIYELLGCYYQSLPEEHRNVPLRQFWLITAAKDKPLGFIKTALEYLNKDPSLPFFNDFVETLIRRGSQRILSDPALSVKINAYPDKSLEEAYLKALKDEHFKSYINTFKPQIATTSLLWQRLFNFNDASLLLNTMPTLPCSPKDNSNIFLKLLIVTENTELQDFVSQHGQITEEAEERFIAGASLEFLKRYYKINTPSTNALSSIIKNVNLPDIEQRLLITFQNTELNDFTELTLVSCPHKKLILAWLKHRKLLYETSLARLRDRDDLELIDACFATRMPC